MRKVDNREKKEEKKRKKRKEFHFYWPLMSLPVGHPNADRLKCCTLVPKIPLTTLRVVLSPEIPGSDFSVVSDYYGMGEA